jgi:hypothetical protein
MHPFTNDSRLQNIESPAILSSQHVEQLSVPQTNVRSGTRTISVIGGGFCGTVAVIQLLRLFTVSHSESVLPERLIINWLDSSGWFGRGLPYRQQERSEDNQKLILNQPAALMSPFPEEPDAYTKWLAREHPHYTHACFTPRSLFGDFLEHSLDEAERAAASTGRSFTINRRREKAKAIDACDYSIVCGECGVRVSNDAVIVATGHHVRDNFQHLVGTPHYIDAPFDVARFRSLGLERLNQIILIGGGPSAIDAARILDGLGYRGSYRVIARRLSPPWPFIPEVYLSTDIPRFEPQYLRPEHIPEDATYRHLQKLLRKEVLRARAHGYGDGHVYYGIDLGALEHRLAAIHDRTAAKEFGALIAFLRGNTTAPENLVLLRKLLRERRLTYLKGHALPNHTVFSDTRKRYETVVLHPRGARVLTEGDALVNCALFVRSSSSAGIAAPASPAVMEKKIFLVGPALTNSVIIPRTWGVESFREEIRNAARSALRAFN